MITPEVQVVLDWHAALNDHDVERLVALSAEDVEVGGPRGIGNGVELLHDWVARAHVRLDPTRWHARDNTVVVLESAQWETPDGQLTAPQQVASVFQVTRGRVSSVIRHADPASALTAAGLTEQLSQLALAERERDYSHRDIVDKLGIKPGHAVAFAAAPVPIDANLRSRALEKAGREEASGDEPVDVVLIGANASTDVERVLKTWRRRIDPAGGIWLLTPKRGQQGYVDQRELILAGPAAGVVDNKIASVSDTTSAMRFVIRKTDRVYSRSS